MPALTPARPQDADDVVALFARYDAVEFGSVRIEAAEVVGWLTTPGTEAVVVREGGTVVGYAHLADNGEAESLVEPGRTELHDTLLAWVLTRARERAADRLEHWGGPRDDGLAARALLAAGYAHVRTVWRLSRDLTGPLPAPVWPAGSRPRPFLRDRDAREVHALATAAFAGSRGSHPRSFEEWSHLVLDAGAEVLAVEQEGRLVGVATRFVRLGEGFVGQLAVEAAQRGRGLARALLQEAFRLDAAAGRAATSLTVDGENSGARRLYEGVGMTVVEEYRRWERDVLPAR